ncbi:hypothetical protein BFL40_11675 [Pseudomonas costantinii]|uniref:Uncharacterized protein n=1 Tax=Pseudomonas costantinii TaxID=168469 RepID=A0A1S2V2W2_9PSED|nr:hypothetical protein BFL40_11675 [Pseudomonas costantinii]
MQSSSWQGNMSHAIPDSTALEQALRVTFLTHKQNRSRFQTGPVSLETELMPNAGLITRYRNRLGRVVIAWRWRLIVDRRWLLDIHRLRLDINRLLDVNRRLGVGDDRAYDETADHSSE